MFLLRMSGLSSIRLSSLKLTKQRFLVWRMILHSLDWDQQDLSEGY